MAQSTLCLRRSLPITTALRRSLSSLVPALSSPPLLKPSISSSSPSSRQQSSSFLASIVQSRPFRSYPTVSLSSTKTYHLYKEGDDITEDTILFEGCDYNHWVILMDFPKDTELTPEEMVKTYEETCAKGLNISVEEAKKKMYACSTTAYQGFQAEMTTEESEKFHGLPGVIFVLPDSYIDPEKKEYAGDQYINGTIIPRPHPFKRNTEGKFHDQNKNPDRPPRDNQQGGPMQNQQNYSQNNSQQGDGRNHGALKNYPPQQNDPSQQNFGTPGQGERGGPMPMNPRESFQKDRRGLVTPYLGNYNQGELGNYYPPKGDQSGNGERNFAGINSNYAPPSNIGTYGQGTSSNYGQIYGGQGQNQRFSPMEQGNVQGEQRNYALGGRTGANQVERGNYYPPQGNQIGYGERNFAGNYSNYALPSHSGTYLQGTSSNYGQSYGGQGENQRFSPMEWGNIQGTQRNYAPVGQTWTNQGERGSYYPPQGNPSGYGERNFMGNYSNYALPSESGTYWQGTSSNYGQSYGGQGENQRFLPMERGNIQGEQRNYAPMGQTLINQGQQGNYYPPQGNHYPPQGNQIGHGERNFVGNYSNTALPSQSGTYWQGNVQCSPMEQGNVQWSGYAPVGQTVTNQGERGNYYPPQGNQSGYCGRNFAGNYSNYAPPSHGGTYGQGTSCNYGQSYGWQGENQRFSPMEQGDVQWSGYAPMGQIVTNQGERGNCYPPQGNKGFYGEMCVAGNYSNYAPPSHGGTYGQGGNQIFSPMVQRNVQGEQGNYAPMGPTGTYQGRY